MISVTLFDMLIPSFLLILAVSLLATLILETALGLCCRLRGRDVWLVVLVNLLTNPPVVFAAYCLRFMLPLPWFFTQPPLEALAILTEGCLYRRYGRGIKHPYRFSLAANAFSYLLGLGLSRLL